uniref:Uncharacterized protein n=1 Tax=viral metagenome TaxID=1070528 RepID=A0A6C0CBX2_9ZZZZ
MHSNLSARELPETLNDQILMHSKLPAILLPAILSGQIFWQIFVSNIERAILSPETLNVPILVCSK